MCSSDLASDVVALLISDLGEPKNSGDITDLIPNGTKVVDQKTWMKINEAEVKAGEARGKPRVKATTYEALMALGN